jgi:hypothetical protein
MTLSRFARAGALAAMVVAGLAATPATAAAAGTIHMTASSLGASATTEIQTADTWSFTSVWAQEIDPGSGQASIWLGEEKWALNPDGSSGDEIGMISVEGTVQFDVDSKLQTAHAFGTVDVTRCARYWEDCEDTYQGSLDIAWTGATRLFHNHYLSVGSVSRVSRSMLHSGTTFRLANASISLDGVSLGSTVSPAEGEIFDSRVSEAELYFGKQASALPGTVMAAAAPLAPGRPQAPDLSQGRGPATSFSQTDLGAGWYSNDDSTQTYTYLSATQYTSRVGNDQRSGLEAWYSSQVSGYDSNGWYVVLQDTEASATDGQLTSKGQLAGAAFTGTFAGTTCTSLSPWEQVCVDVSLPVDLTFASTSTLDRYVTNVVLYNPEGVKEQGHSVVMDRWGVVTGSIDGQAVQPSTDAQLQTRDGRVDGDDVVP